MSWGFRQDDWSDIRCVIGWIRSSTNPRRGPHATGKGRITEDGKVLPLEVKAGDKVLFSKYSGTELKLDGTDYLMIREEDVLGVFH